MYKIELRNQHHTLSMKLPYAKNTPYFCHGKIKLLWSGAVRGAPLANGLLLLAAVCGTPLANGKP